MQIWRSFLMAAVFGLLWVAIAMLQGHSIRNWPTLLGGFALFVVVGPIMALLVRLFTAWWKGRS